MDRPRFRFVVESSNTDFFRNWWQSGKDIKTSIAQNAISDEFSSFPSGHSAYSMFAIFLFPAFADYNAKLQKYRGAHVCGLRGSNPTSTLKQTMIKRSSAYASKYVP